MPQIEDALVTCKDCRWKVADHFTTLIRIREGELQRVRDRIACIGGEQRVNAYKWEKSASDLEFEISTLKGMWERLLGTEYPALF